MARMVILMFLCVVVTCMVVAVPYAYASAAVTCDQVSADLAPCVDYLINGGSSVPSACCSGVQRLNEAAVSTADRQATCNCLKSDVGSIPGINLGLAASLPGACGVNLNTNITANTDCAQIQ